MPGFNLGFVHKFSVFLFPALVPRTPGGEGQVIGNVFFLIGRFYTKDALSVWTNLGKHFVVRLGDVTKMGNELSAGTSIKNQNGR